MLLVIKQSKQFIRVLVYSSLVFATLTTCTVSYQFQQTEHAQVRAERQGIAKTVHLFGIIPLRNEGYVYDAAYYGDIDTVYSVEIEVKNYFLVVTTRRITVTGQ